MTYYHSVLESEEKIIIQLPYDCYDPTPVQEEFAEAIYNGITAVHTFVHSSDFVRERYPSKTFHMYEDLLSFINQYMRIELNFEDFIGITRDSILKGFYHSDIFVAFIIDIEFTDRYYNYYDYQYGNDN